MKKQILRNSGILLIDLKMMVELRVRSQAISPEDWSSYFKKLLNSNKVDCTLSDSEFSHFSSINITDHQIRMCELQSAIKL